MQYNKYVSKDDSIIIENHHESIISKEKFDEVQQILDGTAKVCKDGKIALFTNYLRCADCGNVFTIKKSKNIIYYYCNSFARKRNVVIVQ